MPQKVASRELLEENTNEPIKIAKPSIPIYANTHCFVDKTIEVTWSNIYNTFMKEKFPEDLEDVHAYINIKRSKIHKIECKFPVLSCIEAIEWIILHMDYSHLVLRNESGDYLATYYGEHMQT